jgi:hypothetical protein
MVRNMIRVQRGNGTTRPNSLASVSYADLMVLNEQRFPSSSSRKSYSFPRRSPA